jgi:hypothetical protein
MRYRFLLYFILSHLTYSSFCQQTDSTKRIFNISGSINVTNNGISLLPNFSLGKPAVIFNLSAGNGRFSFDPDIRFSLSGKPWGMIFWFRYKVLPAGRFRFTSGTHLGTNFRITKMPLNGDSVEANIVRRYLALEIVPSYFITKDISVGMYYMFSHGLDPGTVNNTHFLTLNTNISNIKISNQFAARFSPQVYYLKQDNHHGNYFNASLSIAKKNFPLYISSSINQKLSGDITGAKDFLWNVSLGYIFGKSYIPNRALVTVRR